MAEVTGVTTNSYLRDATVIDYITPRVDKVFPSAAEVESIVKPAENDDVSSDLRHSTHLHCGFVYCDRVNQ
ncbi:hypothetical protein PG984_016609 [Apiospora sp. TS-2023a]